MKKLTMQFIIALSGLLTLGVANATPPQTGWWWNPAEGGRGFTIEVQNGTLFMAGFMYDNNGNPVWYASGPTPMISDSLYQGTWLSYGNGQTLNGMYKPAAVTNSAVGSVTINFTSPTTASLQLPNGTITQLVRYSFGPATPPNGGSSVCTDANINTANYNAITPGMTIAQVNQTLGCAFYPAGTQRTSLFIAHQWLIPGTMRYIVVYFDLSDIAVTPIVTGSYKYSMGF